MKEIDCRHVLDCKKIATDDFEKFSLGKSGKFKAHFSLRTSKGIFLTILADFMA